jgi:hypothetical protein
MGKVNCSIMISKISNGYLLTNAEDIKVYCKDKEELKYQIGKSIDRILD